MPKMKQEIEAKLTPKEQYKADLKKFHKASNKHVVSLEVCVSENNKRKCFHDADQARLANNKLTGIMKNNLEQLLRTKRYRKLKELYGKAKKAKDKEACASYASQMNEMQKQYNVTWDFCRTTMISIYKEYDLIAIFGTTQAEDVWTGVEDVLYGDGQTLHFHKRGNLPTLRAKEICRGIILSVRNDALWFKYKGIEAEIKPQDNWERNEVDAIIHYMKHSDEIDHQAVKLYTDETGELFNTYRPCFASLKCETIRGKLRMFIHITVEGVSKPKLDDRGKPRHKYGVGQVGCDIGTQTIAYTSNKEVGLKNLSERGQSIEKSEKQEKKLKQKISRSQQAMNPDNYDKDGRIKKGKKVWKKSNNYRRYQKRYRELCRKNAINRQLAINEDVNHLRELGNTFITEPKNAKKLQKRAKETTVNEKTGKINKKKRFGKSIQNRCPGAFQEQAKRKFESTGGAYIEVSNEYRASQYDHPSDTYIKKKLNQRMYKLSDGTEVQRDWYSSYLLFNYDIKTGEIDKAKCKKEFKKHLKKEKALIKTIKTNRIKVLNSGIRI